MAQHARKRMADGEGYDDGGDNHNVYNQGWRDGLNALAHALDQKADVITLREA